MEDSKAIEIARKAIVGKVKSDDDGPVTVTHERKLFRKLVVVEFGLPDRPGVRGADFAARVTINAKSGEVEDIQAGS
jgi:hypothetical protein